MNSPIRRPALFDRLRLAVQAAGRSPMLVHRPVTRPWLRLIGTAALSAVLVVAAMVALSALFAGLTIFVPDVITPDLLSEAIPDAPDRLYRECGFLIVLAGALLSMALAILAAAAIVHRRPISDFQWPGRKPSGRLLAAGFVIMALTCLVLWPFGWLVAGRIDAAPVLNPAYLADSRILYALVASVMLFLAAAAEEIVFRGVLLRLLGGLTQHAWLLVLINGVLFSLIHLDPDPAAFAARALSGMVWTWAALRLGGIEFAVGAHWANNLLIALLGEPMSAAASVDQKIPAVYLVPEVVIAVVIVFATEWLARRRETVETN